MSIYPANIRLLDAATFHEEFEDVALKPAEMEGGYVISRPRFTRAPRRTWSFAYVEMKDADKLLLENHWKLVKGRSNIFQWAHPISGDLINVRFGEMKMRFSRSGYGPINLWKSDTVVIVEV